MIVDSLLSNGGAIAREAQLASWPPPVMTDLADGRLSRRVLQRKSSHPSFLPIALISDSDKHSRRALLLTWSCSATWSAESIERETLLDTDLMAEYDVHAV